MLRWRAELRAVLRLAGPVIAAQLGTHLLGTVDAMMLGRVSDLALASGALGASLSFGLMVVPLGVLMALDPLVAQAHGARDREAMGHHFQRGLLLALVLSLPLALIFWDTRGLLRWFGQQPEVTELAAAYLQALIPGLVPFLLATALRQTMQAMSIVRPALFAIIITNIANALGNYALIFGHWGCPALGVVGSAYATAIARWVMLAALVAFCSPVLRGIWSRPRAALWSARALRAMLAIGVPIGLHGAVEMWLFTTVSLLMGSLGAEELASHQITINLAALFFMIPFGLGGAAATRVGNAIGARSMARARRSAVICLILGVSLTTVSAALFWFFPEMLARLYTDEPRVIALAATLLPIAALFQVFDGTQVVAAGILRGAADTRVPALLAALGFWALGLPIGVWLAFREGWGPAGLWWGLTTALGSVAALLLLRIWRRLRGRIEASRATA
jgi:MATE family multidrug resistance protein